MKLDKLLKPRNACVVGASEKVGFSGDTCRNIIQYMEEGTYFFVNPKREQIFGKICYHTIEEIPENFDLVIICTPQNTVETILKQAAKKGAGGAVVFASGYAEVGTPEGIAAQKSLQRTCNELDIALMGPNCAGYINYIDMIYPFGFISEDRDRKGSVGVISQSGQICLSLMESPNMRFSYNISAGNNAVVQIEDYLEFLINDENTKIIAMYLEGIKNPSKFVDCLRKAAETRKPIVILKTGKSEKGSKTAASHTGSLSGVDKVFDAIFKKFGVIRVDDIEELLATSLMFATLKDLPIIPTVASMNLSGGETGVCADVGSIWGIEYPDFTTSTLEKLSSLLPSYSTPDNPLDMTATLSYDTDLYAEVLRTVMRDENIGVVAIGYTLLERIVDPAIKYMAKAIEIVAAEPDAKPIVMIPFVENSRNIEYTNKLEKIGVPILPPTVYAFKILKYLINFSSYKPEERELKLSLPTNINMNRARRARTENQSKKLVSNYGISIPNEYVVKTEEEAIAYAEKIGFPIVMKISSTDILHKSDIGCVKLNIKNKEDVSRTFHEILNNATSNHPNAEIDGVLIQEMLLQSIEFIIGVTNDPQFGPIVMCGLGGIFVEIFQDISLYPAPINESEAMQMVHSLKGYKLLNGYRGQPKLDVDALIKAIVAISQLAIDNKNVLAELDVNPIFVYEKGVSVADALMIEFQ